MSQLKVIRADAAGACFGVQRALDLAYEAAAASSAVCTLGPLIHNPGVVNALHDAGIEVADTVADVGQRTVVVRSHGVTPGVMEALQAQAPHVVDATCPHVMRAHKAAERLAREGYHVIVVGEAGHPEVEGISGHALAAGGTCTVVGSADDIPVDVSDPVGVVVQTTQSRANLNMVLDALKKRGVDPQVHDTICSATQLRQEAAAELAQSVDVMLVLGGKNSSNTTRLYELCQANCPRAHHIEGAEEIDPAWFSDCARVGITAGASTPEDQIATVIDYLETLDLS